MQPAYHFGRGWSRLIPYLLMLPGLGLYLVFAFGPSLATAVFSLTDITAIPTLPFHWVGLKNYYDFFFLGVGARDNLQPLIRTLIFAFVAVILNNGMALLVAILLNQKLRGTNFFRSLFFVPSILGVTVVAMIWNFFLYPLDGPAQKILSLFGLRSNFLGSPVTAFPLVILILVWMSMGFAMVIYLAGLQSIPAELTEAAYVDGATFLQNQYYIVMPLLAPTITVNLLIGIIGSLREWALVLLLTGGQFRTALLGLQIYQTAFATGGGNQGYAAAISMLQFFLILVIAGIAYFFLRRREERFE
jgi:raffinose/stachyose/melibiose transport system permease protein